MARSDKGKKHKKAEAGDKRLGSLNWMLGNVGRKRIFEKEGEVLQSFVEYVEWCENNPVKRQEAIKSGQNAGKTYYVDVKRAITWEGFANHIGVSSRTLRKYKTLPEYEKNREELEFIEDNIGNDKVVYGLAGIYDPRLSGAYIGISNKEQLKGDIRISIDKNDVDA